jgi:hypothetical protein
MRSSTNAPTLFIIGISLMILSFLVCPNSYLIFQDGHDIASHSFVIICAFGLARLMVNLAQHLLHEDTFPWYQRKGALALIVGLNLIGFPLLVWGLKTMPSQLNSNGLALISKILEFLGMELFWITMFGWSVAQFPPSNNQDTQPYQASSPRFFPFKPFDRSDECKDPKDDCQEDPF